MSTRGHEFAGILFDMDGTLVDTEPLWDEAERLLMTEFDVPWTAEDNEFCIGGPASRVTDYMADLVIRSGQPRPDSETLWDGLVRFMVERVSSGHLIVQEGALPLLADARGSGLPTALVSSSPRVLMDAVLGGLGADWFDLTVAGDEVERPKPDPQPYLSASTSLGMDPRWCIAVEDSSVGVSAAESAGAFVVAMTHTVDFDPKPRRVPVSSLLEVSLSSFDDWFTAPDGTGAV